MRARGDDTAALLRGRGAIGQGAAPVSVRVPRRAHLSPEVGDSGPDLPLLESRIALMRTTRAILLALFIGATLAAAQQAQPEPPPSIDLPPKIARVLTDYEAAWQKGDAAALAKLFA